MHMLHRYSQRNELIHKPCHVNHAFIFGYDNQIVAFFRIFGSKLDEKLVGRSNRLLHVIQASVTWYPNDTLRLEIQLKGSGSPLYNQNYLYFTLLNFRAINIGKELIVQHKLILARVSLHAFQVYLIFIKLTHSYIFQLLQNTRRYNSGDKDTKKYPHCIGKHKKYNVFIRFYNREQAFNPITLSFKCETALPEVLRKCFMRF